MKLLRAEPNSFDMFNRDAFAPFSIFEFIPSTWTAVSTLTGDADASFAGFGMMSGVVRSLLFCGFGKNEGCLPAKRTI